MFHTSPSSTAHKTICLIRLAGGDEGICNWILADSNLEEGMPMDVWAVVVVLVAVKYLMDESLDCFIT
jgi:hypothetical protein